MRVLFDSDIFSRQLLGGVSRYFASLIEGLPHEGIDVRLACWASCNRYLAASPAFHGLRLDPRFKPFRRYRNLLAVNRPLLSRRLGEGWHDVLHLTYYDVAAAERNPRRARTVITIHDMIPERRPQDFRDPERIHEGKPEAAQRADLILADSEATRRDVIEIFKLPESRVRRCHLGFDAEAFRERGRTAPRPALPERYVLFVGLRAGYKNFARLAEALAPLMAADRDLHLVCVGGGGFRDDERAALANLGIAERTRQISPDDGGLFHAYAGAAFFVFPSLLEGFGYPLVEAWSAGCPVLAAAQPCLEEIGGEAALYFPPEDVAAMRETIEAALGSPGTLDGLVKMGDSRLGNFTVEAMVARTAEAYRSIV